MKFTKAQLEGYLDEGNILLSKTETFRHGANEYYIIPLNNKHYRVCIFVHGQEGMQLEDETDGVEVKSVKVEVEKWVKV